MGQVFTWDAIQRGQIPKKESFHRVASILRDELANEPAIASALIFGSVLRGDFNIRSDVDCVVIYHTNREKRAMKVMQEIDLAAHALHVPINYTPCDTVVAETRLHHLGPAFTRHLQSSIYAHGLIKGSLVDLIAPTIPEALEIEAYIKMKMYSLQESLAEIASYSDERIAALLKKALEAPMHVARKMLIYEGTLSGDSKRDVRERYREVMPKRLAAQFDWLVGADIWYSSELEAQASKPNEMSYAFVISGLRAELPKVLEFLRSNILRLN